MTLSRTDADNIRAAALEAWEPRQEIADRYGVSLSNVYRALSNRAHLDPQFDPTSLAKPTRREPLGATPWAVVDEIRSVRQQRYESLSTLARKYGLEEGTVSGILSNTTRTDPDYDPSRLVARDDIYLRAPRTSGFIYGLTCSCGSCPPDRIQYVGQTVQSPEKRLSAHRNPRGKDRYTKRAKWVESHGPDNIRVVILETDPEEGLDIAEIRNIERHDTFYPNGYNMTPGGYAGAGSGGARNNAAKLTEMQVREIIDRLEEPDATSRGLAADYGVTKTLILKIDHGDLWPTLPRPNGTHRLNRNRKMNLTPDDVRSIRSRVTSGERVSAVARDLGVSWHVVNSAAKGQTWKGIQ